MHDAISAKVRKHTKKKSIGSQVSLRFKQVPGRDVGLFLLAASVAALGLFLPGGLLAGLADRLDGLAGFLRRNFHRCVACGCGRLLRRSRRGRRSGVVARCRRNGTTTTTTTTTTTIRGGRGGGAMVVGSCHCGRNGGWCSMGLLERRLGSAATGERLRYGHACRCCCCGCCGCCCRCRFWLGSKRREERAHRLLEPVTGEDRPLVERNRCPGSSGAARARCGWPLLAWCDLCGAGRRRHWCPSSSTISSSSSSSSRGRRLQTRGGARGCRSVKGGTTTTAAGRRGA